MNMKYSVFSLKAVVLAAAVGILSACAGSASTGPVPEGHYRVQPGDNLYRIGLRFGQSVNTLARWNNLPRLVLVDLLRGRLRGHRGQAHRAAIVLGLKPDPEATPGASA